MFYSKCGEHVKLSNENRTATRSASEFNHGLVFSSEPLIDEELFEIHIDKKTESWIGSIEIGVTTCHPSAVNFCSGICELSSRTWVLSGKSVLLDGRTLVEMYSLNLDKITEGETVGVLRTKNGDLEFYHNGTSHGPAAINLPSRVYAVINVYGNVSQISVIQKTGEVESVEIEDLEVAEVTMGQISESSDNLPDRPTERLRFHERTGSLVKLSCNGRAAERIRPLDEFNNAIVMSKRPLLPDHLFEIRIDVLVEKWSGSIEVGVTTHDPSTMEFPTTMTNMTSGTVMMSGCGILTNGKGTNREYGEFNLDELRVGDRIGMMVKSNGDLHYFINGLDQGVAAKNVSSKVWGVVDLYGMTVKVTIVDRDEREEQNLITRRNTVLRETVATSLNGTEGGDEDADERLLFHPNCGSHAAVINNGRTAHRPNALDEFNNAVVLTNRPLRLNEVFEVKIDKMVTKWAGSIEIGVTTHAPTKLEYPSTMTNVRSGTWIMTGNGVMHNGTSVIDDYGQNLDKLQTGDRVGVVVREGGSLHFLVNGEDQGEAGSGLPGQLYAVIDLYGQASQATIVSHCPSCSPLSPVSPLYPEIHFHSVHGRNARITNGGRSASRPGALVEFNDAIVITNRPLRSGEMFSVIVERIIDRWSGSIEAGVTAIKPDELELPGTMTDIDHDTWMLSGFTVMKDGIPLKQGYPLNLDKVKTGSVVGIKRHEDSSLHYYLDGVDQGEACTGLPSSVYPVIDLYGQCAQVSIVCSPLAPPETDDASLQQVESHPQSESTVLPPSQPLHQWHEVCGKGLRLSEGGLASRPSELPSSGLLFSSAPLAPGETWELLIEGTLPQWASSLYLGLTGFSPLEPLPHSMANIKQPTWYIHGSSFYYCGEVLKRQYCGSLDWLIPGSRVGLKRCLDSSLHFYIDGHDQGIAATNIPKKLYGVVELYGSTSSVRLVSKACSTGDAPLATHEVESSCEKQTEEECEVVKRTEDNDKSIEDVGELLSEIHDLEVSPVLFHDCHGRNVQLSESRLAAKRVSSYNQGLVLAGKPLPRGVMFQIRIESLNPRWVSSLSIGMTSESVVMSTLPVTALGLKKDTWVIAGDTVFHNGHKVKSRYGSNLDALTIGKTVGIMVDDENQLRVFVNSIDQGIAAVNVPSSTCLPLVDLYGMCDQVCIVWEGTGWSRDSPSEEHIWTTSSGHREKGHLEVVRGGKLSSLSTVGHLRSKSDKMNENIQSSSHVSPSTAGSPSTLLFEKRGPLKESSQVKSPTVVVRSLGGSLAVTPISPASPLKQPLCDYLAACLRLRASLGLPGGYFRKEISCYCNGCNSSLRNLGKADIPAGWVLLPLRKPAGDTQVTEAWHVAYLTTHIGKVRRILDLGQVLLPGEFTRLGDIQRRVDRKLDDSGSTKLVLSPSLSGPNLVYKHQYTDPKTKEQLSAWAALQVLVRPGSYMVASETDWVTKERNSTSLSALLLRLDSPLSAPAPAITAPPK